MPGELFDRGLAVRKQVLGTERVEQSMASADPFIMPMIELTTEMCWGSIWTRPGLPQNTRSLLVIAMLAALNRQNELETHVAAALDNGCTVEEIREVLLQAAVYCGIPAGFEAFRTARKALTDRGVDLGSI